MVMVKSGEKGYMRLLMNPATREELQKKYDRTANIKTYAMASFGSAWGVLKVYNVENYI